ncbi:hypothetical protein, partial [Tessaracoccus antarcticus]|uniref:hypothetical protein n=1 Tax=Tessaracoccus antarcticus TaxID=2479848 RepID=UPI0018F708D3
MIKHVLTLLAAASLAVASTVAAPSPASAEVNVYTTPGRHVVGGREWKTTCSSYDANITRCRAEIMSGGKWLFNNLTYLAVDRKIWFDNPLARPGYFSSGGREWLTSCNDGWTGASACRSFIKSGRQWLFNSLVYFTPGTVDYPKFVFSQETGRLTAAATPTTRRWVVADVPLYVGVPGGASSGTILKGSTTISTQRTTGSYSEIFHKGTFGWVKTGAMTLDSIESSRKPVPTVKPSPTVKPAQPVQPPAPPVQPPAPPVQPPVVPAASALGSVAVGSASYPV